MIQLNKNQDNVDTELPHVIIAEDDPISLKMYTRMLEKRYRVSGCSDGAELVATIAKDPADLVLVDNEMPNMNGIQTIDVLRRSERFWNLPIIVISSHDEEEEIIQTLEYGADDYIIKPVRQSELTAKATIAMRHRKAQTIESYLRRGAVFNGKYRIDSQLGEGGSSRVFLAKSLVDEKHWVALKVFDELRKNSEYDQMRTFLREAYEHSLLKHPNIVELFDFGQIGHAPYLVMEYFPGVSLSDLVDQHGMLPQEQIVQVFEILVDVIVFLEDSQLIHRDIKPSNILVGRNNEVKLLDFGLARKIGEQTITDEEFFRGTPQFASPEQIMGDEKLSQKSDIYSLGATLYSVATDKNPFLGDNPMDILKNHLMSEIVPAIEIRPTLHPGLNALIQACMSKEPERRPNPDTIKKVLHNLDLWESLL